MTVPETEAAPGAHEFSVSELANAIRSMVEGAFGRVRVRGEVTNLKRAPSGHVYFDLKDADALLNAVCWRTTAARIKVQPENGMEVVVSGKLTTYPGSSRYQVVVDSIALAGVGALLKLLEDRKKKLAAEGLFDPSRKRPIPYLPEVIGVITSPTGAVIRDILHRLRERFPRRVLLWPVSVQGETAAAEIAAAIAGFNTFDTAMLPRPDVLIVARGGGSIEDLWAFNEEIVVRAVAASTIPVISAVGHETDTTLIDFAADLRAPTPTAAAEMAVPMRADLVAKIAAVGSRLATAQSRVLERRRLTLSALGRGLRGPRDLLGRAEQRLDHAAHRLEQARSGMVQRARQRLDQALPRLSRAHTRLLGLRGQQLVAAAARLRPTLLGRAVRDGNRVAIDLGARLRREVARGLDARGQRLEALANRLEALSHHNVLARGYALVTGADGQPLTSATGITPGTVLDIELKDGHIPAVAGAGVPAGPARPKPRTLSEAEQERLRRQGSLW